MTSHDRHLPVLAQRCLDLLEPAVNSPGAVLIDATLGLGGHAEAALRRFEQLRVIGIDRDPAAIAAAQVRLAEFGDRFCAVHAVYDEIAAVAATYGTSAHAPGRVQGILFDLGVSSMQLDEAERGFSYAQDAPLDMRMDQSTGPTAADLLAHESEADLRRILYQYGEEKFAPRIAGAIVRARAQEPITRSGQLVQLVRENIPHAARRTGGNPAKRTFQALRIAVNAELDVLARALPAALDALAVGGRIVVESYQSLEDRLVKQALAAGARSSAPVGLPVTLPEHEPSLRLLTRGAERADEDEVTRNPRSASVRVRAAERLREGSPA
ncbi:16S rRNA (cytosine(1402)-N(4))-methyltransferase RsmH [Ruania halotolerans]|uniref:16S rRNA (cytosine(1402)-N(4))-methyltransferase RsmH n=1 Tax=Ruania halotolerans TaxID=2897773 RepID=UPI001E308598|nr:16S rRNA (cytosine(1402)-N(4))-methyltransferase RsmH [Ruania halotolerans]UFU05129.1 16S rRNA (cytosine(1402)-N(4))-methyltransferase RsmH [Ruania halotolerans]